MSLDLNLKLLKALKRRDAAASRRAMGNVLRFAEKKVYEAIRSGNSTGIRLSWSLHSSSRRLISPRQMFSMRVKVMNRAPEVLKTGSWPRSKSPSLLWQCTIPVCLSSRRLDFWVKSSKDCLAWSKKEFRPQVCNEWAGRPVIGSKLFVNNYTK